MKVVLSTDLPGLRLFKRGKVRDMYDLGDRLLMVATDRISCFDVVLPNGIPYKGEVLTRISCFWFKFTERIVPNHVITCNFDEFPEELRAHEVLRNRSMIVRKTKPLPVECVVRGYISGSAWKEYREKGTVCGIRLPSGLSESDRLPEPIFTPTTKAGEGHDVNMTYEEVARTIGGDLAERVREKSLEVYTAASKYAEKRGIIIADTKFEFGLHNGKLMLIDELLTPDSSRFWPADQYSPGRAQISYDKQYARDYLESIGWNKCPPAPSLPEEVVLATSRKYIEALRRLTGEEIP
ncbi:MAG: phosphoribosylaminoimidazolesuccinocarboxamide synthase [Candidatus Hadarchaeales archaeon]